MICSTFNQRLFILLLFTGTVMFLFSSCKEDPKKIAAALEQLEVQWELLANKTEGGYSSDVQFIFINKGTSTIRQGNWFMEFNQDNILPRTMTDADMGIVEHVNGYLFRFIPGKNFILRPGESLVVKYVSDGPFLKAWLAPVGAYFVVHANTPEQVIAEPESLQLVGFDDLERVFPDPEIRATVPNAANTYDKNRNVQVLSTDQIGKIIPTPYQTRQLKGSVVLDEQTKIFYTKGLENEANYLASTVRKLFGVTLAATEGDGVGANAIRLSLAPMSVNGVLAEAYRLTMDPGKGVSISGSDPAGVFYGIQSLLSLLPTEVYSGQRPVRLDAVEILDAPRFTYRGFLFDVARNFHSKEEVMKLIDLLAMYKINSLNIRITEDEGWRIEINGLPELTEVGSKRGYTSNSKDHLQPAFGSGPFPDSENNRGRGYYTRDDFKAILQYAANRHIQVIPEVCFPSHARAAIMAMEKRYDHYMALGDVKKAEEFRLIDPDDKSEYLSAQSFKDNIVNVALPSAYHFYETVVKNFLAMYEEVGLKMTVFNTGGDEVASGAWAGSPMCIELMKSLPDIDNPKQLHGYFVGKTIDLLQKYNLLLTGWEEMVLNKDPKDNTEINTKYVDKNVMPLIWNNLDEHIDLGYRIANAGYPVILCNVTNLYIDLAYNTDPFEPGLYWGGFQDDIDPYLMTPFNVFHAANYDFFGRFTSDEQDFTGKEKLKPDNRKNIKGIQLQLWAETLRETGMMEYYTVPKIFAFAEKAWAKEASWENEINTSKRVEEMLAGWSEFSNRIGRRELPRIDAYFGSFNYRIAPPGAIIEGGLLKANTAYPGLIIRYTTDGSEPMVSSAEYTGPINVEGTVKIRAFNAAGRGSKTFVVNP